jgi:hypothetical protein
MFKKISEKLNVMCDFPTLFFVLAPFSFFYLIENVFRKKIE